MDNQKDHINPWAKKLEESSTPESDGWSSLEGLLDRHMPVQKRKERRRLLLTAIFLLLLIGVCNYPGLKTTKNTLRTENNQTDQDSIRTNSQQNFITNNSSLKKETNVVPGNRHDGASPMEKKNRKDNKSKTGIGVTASDRQVAKKVPADSIIDRLAQKKSIGNSDSSLTDLSSGAKTVAKTKTVSPSKKTPEKNPGKSPEEDKKGFAFTLGLNQFFPVGTQDKTNYNSNGTTGGISDYIPVPGARYYFHNWLYLEGEIQINSPQYTNSLLVDQKIDYSAGQPLVQSAFIRKLFYFNIPVSIHFSPVKNLFIGAGIQYSHLTNGVALYQEANYVSGYTPNRPINDTGLIYSEVRDFKSDTSYQKLKTSEWRFLLDVNYQWKRFTIGLRYNQAFNNFINVQVSTGIVTQAHNSSLQLYLQYMLWDNRKKVKKTNP